MIWRGKSKAHCNPGSVGQPRDDDPRASYAIWSGEEFELKRVTYDYMPLQMRMNEAKFEPYYYENLSSGTRLGGKIDSLPTNSR